MRWFLSFIRIEVKSIRAVSQYCRHLQRIPPICCICDRAFWTSCQLAVNILMTYCKHNACHSDSGVSEEKLLGAVHAACLAASMPSKILVAADLVRTALTAPCLKPSKTTLNQVQDIKTSSIPPPYSVTPRVWWFTCWDRPPSSLMS